MMDDSTQITFSELRCLSASDIALLVSKEKALSICANYQGASAEILHLWINKLLEIYIKSNTFCAEDWQQLVECLRKGYSKLFSEAIHQWDHSKDVNLRTAALAELKLLLSECQEFLKCVKLLNCYLSLKCYCILTRFIVELLLEIVTTYSKCSKQLSLDEHLANGIRLHTELLQFIGETIGNCKIQSAQQLECLIKFIETLNSLAENLPPDEVKVIMETWKCIVKLIVQCCECARYLQALGSATAQEWIRRPLKYSLNQVKKNVQSVYKKEVLSQSLERVEKYLRFTNFYVKLVHILASKFKHEAFPEAKEYMELYGTLKSVPAYLEQTEILSLLEKHVAQVFTGIFKLIYKNPQVASLLQSHKSLVTYDFAVEYLQLVVTNCDHDYIVNNTRIYKVIFEAIINDPSVFVHDQKYNKIIEMFAALTILNRPDYGMQRYFMVNVAHAQSNFMALQGSMDILKIVSSYYEKQGIVEHPYQHFRYWLSYCTAYSLYSHNLRRLCAIQMTRHYYRVCKATRNGEREFGKDFLPLILPESKNYSVFMVLGIPDIYEDPIKQEGFAELLCNEIPTLLRNCNNSDDYYKIVLYLKALSSCELPPPRGILLPMVNLASQLYVNHSFTDYTQTVYLMEVIFGILKKFISVFDNGLLERFLTAAIKAPRKRGAIFCKNFMEFLNACSHHGDAHIHQLVRDLVRMLQINKETAPLLSIFMDNIKRELKNSPVDYKAYNGLDMLLVQEPECLRPPLENLKRRRIESDDSGDLNLQEILADMLRKSKLIANGASKFSVADLTNLREIQDNLNKALDRQ